MTRSETCAITRAYTIITLAVTRPIALVPTFSPRPETFTIAGAITFAWAGSCNWTGSYADNWWNLAEVEGNKFGSWNLEVASTAAYEVSFYLFHPALQTPLNQ